MRPSHASGMSTLSQPSSVSATPASPLGGSSSPPPEPPGRGAALAAATGGLGSSPAGSRWAEAQAGPKAPMVLSAAGNSGVARATGMDVGKRPRTLAM